MSSPIPAPHPAPANDRSPTSVADAESVRGRADAMGQRQAQTPGEPGRLTVYVVFGAAVWPGGVPSGALRRRTLGALDLSAQAAAADEPRCFLVTGGVGQHGPSEAAVMRRLLQAEGVPDREIVLEDQAKDTLDSVVLCERILAEPRFQGADVVAVSSAYHVPRCRLLFRIAGRRVRGGPIGRSAPAPPMRSRGYAALRECVALPWDAGWMLVRRLGGGLRHSGGTPK